MIPAAHPPFSTSPSCCRMQLSGPLRPSVCAEAGGISGRMGCHKTENQDVIRSWFSIHHIHHRCLPLGQTFCCWDGDVMAFLCVPESSLLDAFNRWVRTWQFWCAQSSRNISNTVCLPTQNQGFLPRMKGFPTLQASSPSTLGSGATATEASQWRDDIWIAWRPRCKPHLNMLSRGFVTSGEASTCTREESHSPTHHC